MTAIPSNSGGHLLVKCLQSLGANKCFGVPGESYLDVLDALYDTQGAVDFVLCRNEGGAAFMAEAYGKLTGLPGICMVTRGPGATNASIGIHTAKQNSSPMILFIGQVGSDFRDREAFQEIDYRAFYGSVAKWVVEIDDADRIPELLSRAWRTALSGRPGPVVVVLPEDMLCVQTNATPCQPVRIAEPAPSPEDIEELTSLLSSAEKPLVIIGGSGWNKAGRFALQQFAQNNNLPVAAAFRFQDLFDNHSGCYIGEAGVGMAPALQATIKQADVILAMGIRFGEMTTAGYTLLEIPYPNAKLIHVHASDGELGKVYTPVLPIHASPNLTARALKDVELSKQWNTWGQLARDAYLDSFDAPVQPGAVDMVAISKWLRDQLPNDVIVTNGAGNFTVWPNKFLCFGPDQRLLAPQSGAMGYGLPAAIAAKVVQPDATVVCFAGDGDFQMNCQELGTAMQANACPIILILNNGSYGTIRMHQERHYPNRVSATDLINPDFIALAKAYGFHAERVSKTSEFPDAYQRATKSASGAVLELKIATEAITPRQTLSEIRGTQKSVNSQQSTVNSQHECDCLHRILRVSMTQKTILITGATDGIGLETAKLLAGMGHNLLLHGRSQAKLASATSDVTKLAKDSSVQSYLADLSIMEEVAAFASSVAEKQDSLDVLINNAGVLGAPNSTTTDGLEIRFAVNTIAPYLLTQRLLPLLDSSARVINLSSAAQSAVDPARLLSATKMSDMDAYAQSKLAITMWSRSLALALADNGPAIIAVNPGSLLGSKMVKEGFGVGGKDLSIGADILVRAALADEFSSASAKYFDNDSGQFASPHTDALDARKCQEVVSAIESVLARLV